MDDLGEWGIEVHNDPVIEEYVPEKVKGKSVFDIMMSAFNKKFKPSQAEKDSIPEFLFHQILSNDPKTVQLALMFTTHKIPVAKQWDMVNELLPKCFIAYPKKSKVDNEVLDTLSDYYNCSMHIADRYSRLLTTEQIVEIQTKFLTGKMKKGKK